MNGMNEGMGGKQMNKKRILLEHYLKGFRKEARRFIYARLKTNVPQHRVDSAISKAMKGYNAFDLVVAIQKPESFCGKCGECCRTSDPIRLHDDDVVRFGEMFGEHFNTYVVFREGIPYLRHTKPCVFLRENKCSIYQNRPLICRQFPIVSDDTGKPVLGILPHCTFTRNILKMKALMLLVTDEIKHTEPRLAKKLDEIGEAIRKAEGEKPSLEQQIKIAQSIGEVI